MKMVLPCAIYTRKSSEEGLEQGFNSLDAQREACEAFILSQKEQGWKALDPAYEDGGFSGGNTERPGLKRLLADIGAGRVRIVVVYKVDRLTRSLADFAKLVELFDKHNVSFVSVTQQFNTTSSMGRLTLNVLLSFAQFEREVTGERIRDKIAASKRKGLWMGGPTPIGYQPHERSLVIDEPQAARIREIYRLYLELGCVRKLREEISRLGWVTPPRKTRRADAGGGRQFSRGHLYRLLSNPLYVGQIAHKDAVFEGQHPAIVDRGVWQAVQIRLATNRQGHRTRSTAAEPALLAGLVFDEKAQRLTPSHATKGARRYRYYVGEHLHTAGRRAAPDALRIPAPELEETVLRAFAEFLLDKTRLVAFMGNAKAVEASNNLSHAAELADRLSTETSSAKIEILQRIVARITIHPQRLEIAIRVEAIWSPDTGAVKGSQTTVIHIPVQLKRCGMAVRLILRAKGEAAKRGPDPKLVALLAKAHDWFSRLMTGRADSVRAIAREERVSSSYVTRVIYLAFLAPDLVQEIARGQQPVKLNADRLIRMAPLPNSWADQRRLFGPTD